MRFELVSLEQCLHVQARLLRRLVAFSKQERDALLQKAEVPGLGPKLQRLHRQLSQAETLRRQAETRALGAGVGTADTRPDIALTLYRCRRLHGHVELLSRELGHLQVQISQAVRNARQAA
ncbi:MAG: hypothetical protein IPP68_06930 [Elusimicrobia bacterium]|nr:hypothetical protein [Elusimicrobiota bacterium]